LWSCSGEASVEEDEPLRGGYQEGRKGHRTPRHSRLSMIRSCVTGSSPFHERPPVRAATPRREKRLADARDHAGVLARPRSTARIRRVGAEVPACASRCPALDSQMATSRSGSADGRGRRSTPCPMRAFGKVARPSACNRRKAFLSKHPRQYMTIDVIGEGALTIAK
jgi:hypothetical protein